VTCAIPKPTAPRHQIVTPKIRALTIDSGATPLDSGATPLLELTIGDLVAGALV
jgi:hypothetical protein